MSLQLALIVLGAVAIVIVVIFSYSNQRGHLFSRVVSFRIPITFLNTLKSWIRLPRMFFSGGLKSALISAIDFRLDPDPNKLPDAPEDKKAQRPINLRQHRAYTRKINK